jgi:hypothetical protein
MEKIVNIIKKVKVSDIETLIGAQILFYAYTQGIWLNKSELDMLVHIATFGYNKDTSLKEIVEKKIFKSEQTVRNIRGKLTKQGFLVETKKKHFVINPEITIHNKGNILYEFKMLKL